MRTTSVGTVPTEHSAHRARRKHRCWPGTNVFIREYTHLYHNIQCGKNTKKKKTHRALVSNFASRFHITIESKLPHLSFRLQISPFLRLRMASITPLAIFCLRCESISHARRVLSHILENWRQGKTASSPTLNIHVLKKLTFTQLLL